MTDMELWQKYLALLESLGRTLEELTELERTKTKAVSSGDLEGVEACMKKEQVVSLSLRGLDQKRDRMLAEMGLTGVPLRELAANAPEAMFHQVKDAAEKLRQQYGVFQSASEVAMDTLECNLRAIERIQKAQEAPPEDQRPHQADFRV
ncbi:MAG: flagellar protein FlgN [Oscillospiraceae bacterium]|nr:flagellar protein FlgN [Oscillospiraceae bacterium]